MADPGGSGRIWYHAVGSQWLSDPGPNSNLGEFDTGTIYRVFIPWASLGIDAEPRSGDAIRMTVRTYDVDDPADSGVAHMDPPPSERRWPPL